MLKLAVGALLAAGVILGLGQLTLPTQRAPVPAVAAISARYVGLDAARMLAETDASIVSLNARVATPLGDMLDREQLAQSWLARARLTGDFADLVSARREADAGIAMAPAGSGPWLQRAAADFAAHQLADAAKALDRVDRFVIPDFQTRAEARAMRGDIAMARGDYAGAARNFATAETIDRWPGLAYRKAVLAQFSGDLEGSRALFAQADALNRDPSPLFRADILLRQGELNLAQGNWSEASRLFTTAARTLPGYWRAEMRVAQMQALGGQVRPAITAFERIATERKSPEAMDIAAGLYRAEGNGRASRLWAAKAATIWRDRVRILPEAGWAHAAEHELAFGKAPLGLALAARNARNRPDGAGLILLARAWIANGRADYAVALCDKVARSGWVSTDLWLVKAEALSLLGRGEEAEDAQAKAKALNPRALERNPAFTWLDH